MDHLSNIFKKHKLDIKNYIFKIINSVELNNIENDNFNKMFNIFSSLENIYIVDKNYNQISPLYSKNGLDHKKINTPRNSLKENICLDKNGEYLSSVYLCSTNGNPTITATKKVGDNLISFNFNLSKLLSDLKYINSSNFFNFMTKFIYASIGYSLSLFAMILIIYSLYNFAYHSYIGDVEIFQLIFKSTIALTLGLAVFDLAKNLLEHEVVFKEQFNEAHGSNKLLEKFLISIIIALSIESLMTVFKIALTDYKDILYAVYLIIAVSVMIIALSYFNKNTKKT
jgi:hypothetical protein